MHKTIPWPLPSEVGQSIDPVVPSLQGLCTI